MKSLARQASIPMARMRAVSDPLDLLEFIAEVGYPVVVKQRNGIGTNGIIALRSQDELRTYLQKGSLGMRLTAWSTC